MGEHVIDTMVVPPTPKPTHKVEVLTRAPATIASSCEENAVLWKWHWSRSRWVTWNPETKRKVSSSPAKFLDLRVNPKIDGTFPQVVKKTLWCGSDIDHGYVGRDEVLRSPPVKVPVLRTSSPCPQQKIGIEERHLKLFRLYTKGWQPTVYKFHDSHLVIV
jgi:hypothetical protein